MKTMADVAEFISASNVYNACHLYLGKRSYKYHEKVMKYSTVKPKMVFFKCTNFVYLRSLQQLDILF